jgi:AraC-like DNA-binding protein
MASSTVRTFTDPDAYHAAIRDADEKGIIIERGNFRADWTGVRLGRLSLQRGEESLPRLSYSAIDPKVFGIVFPTCPGPSVHVHGLETSLGEIIVYRRGSAGYDRSSAACQWGAITLAHEDIAAAGEAIIGRELTAPPLTCRIRPPPPLLSRLLNLHKAAGHLARTAPDLLAKSEIVRALDHAFVDAMVACLAVGDPVDDPSAYRHHSRVMQRLEEFLQANAEGPSYMAEVCAAVGVSYPTLRTCCQEHLGMSPKRFLLLRRMHLARRALLKARPETTTVTEVATNFGFWELGRFSVAYRSLFGESPSTALRRTTDEAKPSETGRSPRQFTGYA